MDHLGVLILISGQNRQKIAPYYRGNDSRKKLPSRDTP